MKFLKPRYQLLVSLLMLVTLTGCYVKFVPDYDASIQKQVVELTEMVDILYRKIGEKKEDDRSFEQFSEAYFEIETKINSLLVQQKARPQNKESVMIVEITKEKFIKYRDAHQKANAYPDFDLKYDRKILGRMLASMLNSEKWKQVDES